MISYYKDRINSVLVIDLIRGRRNYSADRFVKIAKAMPQNCLVI